MVDRHNIGRRGGVRGTIRYLFAGRREEPSDKKAELLGWRGVGTRDAEEMADDFELGQQANPNLSKTVWHLSISFNPDDAAKIDSHKMREIAEGYLKKMGMDQTQYLLVRHHDTSNNHLHLVVNRVADDGKTISDSHNYYYSKKALKELAEEHQFTLPVGLRPEKQDPQKLHGTELVRRELRQALRQELTTATKLPGLTANLRSQGLEVRYRVNQAGKPIGISFAKEGIACRGSELGKEYSLAGIERQLAANLAQQQAAAAEAKRQQQVQQEQVQLRQRVSMALTRQLPGGATLEELRRRLSLTERLTTQVVTGPDGQVQELVYGFVDKPGYQVRDRELAPFYQAANIQQTLNQQQAARATAARPLVTRQEEAAGRQADSQPVGKPQSTPPTLPAAAPTTSGKAEATGHSAETAASVQVPVATAPPVRTITPQQLPVSEAAATKKEPTATAPSSQGDAPAVPRNPDQKRPQAPDLASPPVQPVKNPGEPAPQDTDAEAYRRRATQLQQVVDEAARTGKAVGAPWNYVLQLRGVEVVGAGVRYRGSTEAFSADYVTLPTTTQNHLLVQYGFVEVAAHGGQTALERAEKCRNDLIQHGLLMGLVSEDTLAKTARVSYCVQVNRPDLEQVMDKLNSIQYGKSALKLYEAPHPLRNPDAPAFGLHVPRKQWPEREGGFGEARLSLTKAVPAHQVRNIKAAFKKPLCAAFDLGTDAQGVQQLRVLYHTLHPAIEELNAKLDGAAQLGGVSLQESARQQARRAQGAIEVEKQRTRDNISQWEIE